MEPLLRTTIFFPDAEMPPTVAAASIFRMLIPHTRNVNASKRLRPDTQDCLRTCLKISHAMSPKIFLHSSNSNNGAPRKISSFFFLTIVIFACWSLRTKVNPLWEKLVNALPTKITNRQDVLTYSAIFAITSSCGKEQSTSRKYHLKYTTSNNFEEWQLRRMISP